MHAGVLGTSRSISHYYGVVGKEELLWQCRTLSFCQCDYVSGRKPVYHEHIRSRGFGKLPLAEHARAIFTRPELIRTWHDIVLDYARTSLAHKTDKLAAIDGIAEYMRSLRNSECLAGLWVDSLAFDLLWANEAHNDEDPTRTTHADPLGKTPWSSGKWLFPTWSWASIEGETGWRWTSRFFTDYSPDDVLIQHITDRSSPPNELRLRGVLVLSTIGVIQNVLNSRELYFPDLRNQGDTFGVDKSVECLRVVQSGKDCFSLVLVCVDEEKRQYERLGLLVFRYSGALFRGCIEAGPETQVEVPLWWEPSEDWEGEEAELTLI
ncbi:HET domain-containing protein [Fusarium sp. LHS14.1]|nr:HET domain-containing protein [Fusarium sp. LHS14.1]